MPNGLTDAARQAVHQVEAAWKVAQTQGGLNELTDQSRQGVQASNPLAVAAPVREGSAPVGSDQLVRLLEGGAAEGPLQQTNGDDLRIGKARRIVVGASPGRLCGMLLEIIVHEDIDLGHLVGDGRGYTVHRGSYPFVELDIPRYNFAPIGVVPGCLY